jgi:hypothetical protein
MAELFSEVSKTRRNVFEQYQHLVSGSLSENMLRKPHGEVEQWINIEGHELMRLVLQAHLDERTQAEVRHEEMTGKDGLVRNHAKDDCERTLMTLFGAVAVRRLGYGKYGGQYLYPLDAELNLSGDRYSDGLRRRVAEEVVNNSFDVAVANIERMTAGKVPKRQAEELIVDVAQDFEEYYSACAASTPENTDDLLILSTDGKGIVMRQEALRGTTKKAAELKHHKLEKRLSKGEKGNRKRMATVASVYDVERHKRTAESIMKLTEGTVRQTPPRARGKRVWASVEREQKTVIKEIFQEALRRDPEQKRQWAVLIDGQPQQLKIVQECMKQYGTSGTLLVLDFIHVLEYLWKAAYCFFEEGTKEAESWVLKRAVLILRGKSSGVAAGMRRSATLQKLPSKERKAVDTCAGYLQKYKELVRYDKFLAQGLPIATGIIEGACRHLIADRMDKTGARWGLAGAEAVLKLRSLRSSHDLDAYWQCYKSRSLTRTHISRYAHSLLPLVQAA